MRSTTAVTTYARMGLSVLGLLLFLGSAAFPQGLVTQIDIVPPAPSTNDAITINVFGTASTPCNAPQEHRVTMQGNTIVINVFGSIGPGVCVQVIASWSVTVPLGRLSVGTYQVIVTHSPVPGIISPDLQIGATSFTVRDPMPGPQCPHDGDVNHDGRLSPADALLTFRQFLSIAVPALDACQQQQANVDAPRSSGITPADALCIFRRFLGLASCLDLQFFHTEGRDIVADTRREKTLFRGVNLNGLEFGSFFDNPYPGAEGTNYFKPRVEDFDRIKALSFVNVARVPFEWARLVLGWRPADPLPTALEPAYLSLLDEVVRLAAERRIYVILDMHNFLKYWSGQSAQECVDTSVAHQQLLAHTWRLIAMHFRDNPAVLGYDIMNEPVRQEAGEPCSSCNWHTIAQAVVDGIRAVDQQHLILVEGPNFSLASDWAIENGQEALLTDRVTPPRLVYSPHVFFDANNDSRYDQPGEETGPLGQWQYYVRDRLLPVIDWSMDNNVPIFLGETNVPCTAAWASVLEHALRHFFEPLYLSVTAWHAIDPAHCPLGTCPLNLLACPAEHQLNVLRQFPSGPYQEVSHFVPVPYDSRLYDDGRVNPWDAGAGSFGDLALDFCATDPVLAGSCALAVHFERDNFAGVKLIHHAAVDTRRYTRLSFSVFLTASGQQNFKIFTTAPRPDCDPGADPEYPPYDQRPELRSFVLPLAGQWQQVEIPLTAIVDPSQPLVNGIALQNLGASQEVLYLDEVRFTP